MILTHLPKEKMTEQFMENIHKNVFDETVPSHFFKFDECLIAENNDYLLGYILIKEVTTDMIELAWGGTFKNTRGFWVKKAFKNSCDLLLQHYKIITFQTKNNNLSMIKLGLNIGFKIVGCTVVNGNEIFINFSKGRE